MDAAAPDLVPLLSAEGLRLAPASADPEMEESGPLISTAGLKQMRPEERLERAVARLRLIHRLGAIEAATQSDSPFSPL